LWKARKRYQRNTRADFSTRTGLQRVRVRVRFEVRDGEQRHACPGFGSEEGFDGENFRLKKKKVTCISNCDLNEGLLNGKEILENYNDKCNERPLEVS